MVTAVLTDICRAFPKLTPEVIWNERTRSQMMIYWRASHRQTAQQTAIMASTTRAAVAAAIVNTIAGKETPTFEEMIERLQGDGIQEAEQPAVMTPPVGFTSGSSKLEGFTEF